MSQPRAQGLRIEATAALQAASQPSAPDTQAVVTQLRMAQAVLEAVKASVARERCASAAAEAQVAVRGARAAEAALAAVLVIATDLEGHGSYPALLQAGTAALDAIERT